MYKKKRLFGLFAIMFVAIFSVGCVFATACKKNKDSDEESVPEHVHAYTELNQGDANGHYYTCPDDGEKGEVTAHTYGAWTTTKEATCGDYGTQERSCTVCGYTEKDTTTLAPTGSHTYTSASKATFDWTNFDETELTGVTATVECDVCHTAADAENVTVEAVEGKEDTYVATATLGTYTYESAEYVVGGTTGGEEDVFAITLGQSSVSLDGTNSSADVSVSVTLNGVTYAGSDEDGYDIVISSTNEGIASVTKSITDGNITISTAAVSGTATVTVAVVMADEPKTAIESKEIAVTVTGVGPDTADMASQSISFTADQVQDYTDDLNLFSEDGVSVVAKATNSTSSSGSYNQQVTIDQDENPKADPEKEDVTYGYRLKLNGAGKADYRNVTITTNGAAVIRFVLYSGSSSAVREAGFYKLDGTTSTLLYSNDGVRGYGDLVVWTVAVEEAGTYYMASTSSGINIYAIDVLYESNAEPEPSEDTYTVTITSTETTMYVGDSISLGATVQKNEATISDAAVTWTVTGPDDTEETLTDSTFAPETAGTYTITATYTPEGGAPVVSEPITITVTEKDPIAGTEWTGTAYYDIAAVGLETTLKSDVTLTVSADGKFSLDIGEASATGGNLDLVGGAAAAIVNLLLPDVDLTNMPYTRNGNEYTVYIYEEELGGDIYIYATLGEDRGCEYLSVSFSISMEFGEYGNGSLTVTNQRVWLDGQQPPAVTGVTFDENKEHVVTATATAGTFESELTFTVTDEQGESYPQADWTGSQAWTSSDESVAAVDGLGNVTLTGTAGVAVITLTVDDCSASYVIVVGATEMAEDNEIYGEWAGDADAFVVVYEYDLLGIPVSVDYTVGSTVEIEASADGITITLTIVSATDTSEYKNGEEIVLYENATLYSVNGTYYVITIIDGVAYISEMTIVNGQLSGTFAASTSFNVTSSRKYTGDIEFKATLDKLAEARFAAATGSATLGDEENPTAFENGEISLTVTSRTSSEVTYEIGGTAAVMTESQAQVFWNGTAGVGDAYVIITVTLVEGETISWTSPAGNEKSYKYEDLAEDDGVLGIIIRISGGNIGEEIRQGYASYTITTGDTSVTHTVYFSDVEIPDVAEGKAMAVPSDADITLGENNTVFNNRENFDITYEGDGKYVATGEANIMDEAQAEAYWSGVAEAGDAYIIVGICIEKDQTVYYGEKSWTKSTDDDLALIIRLVAAEGGTGSTVFTVKNADGDTVAVFTVDYSGVVIPDVDVSGSIVEDRIGLVPANESVTLTDTYTGKSDSFINNDTLEVALTETDDGYVFVVTGEAQIMTSDQAEVFWNGVAEAGDAYVIIVVYLNEGETVSFGGKSWKKEGDDDLAIIVRLTAAGTTSFVITDESGNEVLSFVVDFSGVTIPQNGHLGRTAASTAEELTEAIANGAESVIILADIELTESLEIEGDVTITLKENAVLSSSATNVSVISVEAGAALTITGEGTISYTGTDGNTSTANTAAVYTEGTLVIEGGNIESSSIGVKAEAGATVTINEGATIESTYFALWLGGNGTSVTIEGGKISGTNKGIVLCGDGNYGHDDYQANAVQTLNVNGGELSCVNDSVITTLGSVNSSSCIINITGGTLTGADIYTGDGNDAVGTPMPTIYIASGTLNISGDPEITGSTPVEVRGGTTTISGGTFTVEAEAKSSHCNDRSGATSYGYALSVFPYGSGVTLNDNVTPIENTVYVSVTGGTFNGALYAATEDDYNMEDTTHVKYPYADYTFEITGGTFSADPSEYLGSIYEASLIEDEGEYNGYYKVTEKVSKVDLAGGYADEDNNWFKNPDSGLEAEVTVEDDGNVTITVTGTASAMSSEEANDFWQGHAAEGDAYIVVTVVFAAGETVSWTGSDGTVRERTIGDYPEGTFDVVIRISGEDLGDEIREGKLTFTVKDAEGNSKTYTVDFSGVAGFGTSEGG